MTLFVEQGNTCAAGVNFNIKKQITISIKQVVIKSIGRGILEYTSRKILLVYIFRGTPLEFQQAKSKDHVRTKQKQTTCLHGFSNRTLSP